MTIPVRPEPVEGHSITTANLPHRNVIPGLTRNPEDCEMHWIPNEDLGNDGKVRCSVMDILHQAKGSGEIARLIGDMTR